MIYTSADFEYMESVRFHKHAISMGLEAIRNGKNIITDTNMAKAGIRKSDLERFGTKVKCFMTDPEVGSPVATYISLKGGQSSERAYLKQR